MRTICLSIEDTRYTEPTLEFATVRDRNAAREVAHDRLQASPFHVAVKVREDEELLFWLSRLHASGHDGQFRQASL